MTRRGKLASLFIFALALSGCAKAPPKLAALHVKTGPDGEKSCWVEAEGLRSSVDDLPTRARAWRGRKVIIDSVGDTPYRCFGSTIFGMQMAGVKDIGFISEPPPSE